MEEFVVVVLAILTAFFMIRTVFGEYDEDGSIQAGKRARRKRHRDGGMRD